MELFFEYTVETPVHVMYACALPHQLRLGKYYHLANLVADEHGAYPVGGADTQMRRYYFTSCHIYLFPFILLCVLQSIWQFSIDVEPPLLHAAT